MSCNLCDDMRNAPRNMSRIGGRVGRSREPDWLSLLGVQDIVKEGEGNNGGICHSESALYKRGWWEHLLNDLHIPRVFRPCSRIVS